MTENTTHELIRPSETGATDFLNAYAPDGTRIGSIHIAHDGYRAIAYGETCDLMLSPVYTAQRAHQLLMSIAKRAGIVATLFLALAATDAQAQKPIAVPAGCTLTHYWADDGSAIATCSDGSKVIAHDADGQWVEGFSMREPGTWYGLR